MSVLACCLWWFLFGLLLGWLANWLLQRFVRREPPPQAPRATVATAPAPAPPASADELPPSHAPVAHARLIDVGAARAAGFNLRHADDLTIIEGIGPKLDELFRSHGVDGFAALAALDLDRMNAILEQGGPYFRFANPSTWARQAALAADNRWGDLKALQEELIGGVDPTAGP
jgi:predicted flap endonuclease-1-like 5' DNA nuclease